MYIEQTKQEQMTIASNQLAKLRPEVSRIANVTLRGNFVKEEDRQYWVKRLKELNGKIASFEEEIQKLIKVKSK